MKNPAYTVRVVLLGLLMLGIYPRAIGQETTISGIVNDADTGDALIGVDILVKGQVIGTITNTEGKFNLKVNQPPTLTLVFSMVGYGTQEFEINSPPVGELEVTLSEQTLLGQDVVVSASRVEQSILQSPVSIEKMNIL